MAAAGCSSITARITSCFGVNGTESDLQASLTPQNASLRCPQSALLHDGPDHACRNPPNRILVLGRDGPHSRLRLKASAALVVVGGPLLCPGPLRFIVRSGGRLGGWCASVRLEAAPQSIENVHNRRGPALVCHGHRPGVKLCLNQLIQL